jgi:hypothetical protein
MSAPYPFDNAGGDGDGGSSSGDGDPFGGGSTGSEIIREGGDDSRADSTGSGNADTSGDSDRSDPDPAPDPDRGDTDPDRSDPGGDTSETTTQEPDFERRTEESGILENQTDYRPGVVGGANRIEDRIAERTGITDRRNFDIRYDDGEYSVEFSPRARSRIAVDRAAEQTGLSRDDLEPVRTDAGEIGVRRTDRPRRIAEDPFAFGGIVDDGATGRTTGAVELSESAGGEAAPRDTFAGPLNFPTVEGIGGGGLETPQATVRTRDTRRELFGDFTLGEDDQIERDLRDAQETSDEFLAENAEFAVDPRTAPAGAGNAITGGVRVERAVFDALGELGVDDDDLPDRFVQDGEGPFERSAEAGATRLSQGLNPAQLPVQGLEVAEFVATQPAQVTDVDTGALDTFDRDSLRFREPLISLDEEGSQEFTDDVEQRAISTATAAAESYEEDPAGFLGGTGGGLLAGFVAGRAGGSIVSRASGGRFASGSDLSGRVLTEAVDRVGLQQRQIDPDDPSPVAGGPRGDTGGSSTGGDGSSGGEDLTGVTGRDPTGTAGTRGRATGNRAVGPLGSDVGNRPPRSLERASEFADRVRGGDGVADPLDPVEGAGSLEFDPVDAGLAGAAGTELPGDPADPLAPAGAGEIEPADAERRTELEERATGADVRTVTPEAGTRPDVTAGATEPAFSPDVTAAETGALLDTSASVTGLTADIDAGLTGDTTTRTDVDTRARPDTRVDTRADVRADTRTDVDTRVDTRQDTALRFDLRTDVDGRAGARVDLDQQEAREGRRRDFDLERDRPDPAPDPLGTLQDPSEVETPVRPLSEGLFAPLGVRDDDERDGFGGFGLL